MSDPDKKELYELWRDAWISEHPDRNPPSQSQFYSLIDLFNFNPLDLFGGGL